MFLHDPELYSAGCVNRHVHKQTDYCIHSHAHTNTHTHAHIYVYKYRYMCICNWKDIFIFVQRKGNISERGCLIWWIAI